MTMLKAITTDGELQYFNFDLILNITPSRDGERVKILMGAGLFWWVQRDTIEILNYSYKATAQELRGEPL